MKKIFYDIETSGLREPIRLIPLMVEPKPIYHTIDVVQRRYQCLLCGRDKFASKSPHLCVSGYRKHGLKWIELESVLIKNNVKKSVSW